MCRKGSRITVRAYQGKDHNSVVPAATPDAIRFADAVSAGALPPATCEPA